MARTEQQLGLFGEQEPIQEHVEVVCTAFEAFWRVYPRREKKLRALDAWNKLKPSKELVVQILAALDWQVTRPEWTKEHGQFIPLASSWLRSGQWLDERPTVPRLRHWSDDCQHVPTCERLMWHEVELLRDAKRKAGA